LQGYDASNEHDEEVPEEELEFSDDEKEAEAKRLAKKYVLVNSFCCEFYFDTCHSLTSKRKKPQQSGENSAAPSEEKKRPRKRAKHAANEGATMTPVNQAPPYAPQPPGPYYHPVQYAAPWPQPYVAGPYTPQFVAPMPGYVPNATPYPTHINYYAPYPPNLHPPAPALGRGRGNVNQSFVFTNPPNQQQ
jgi:H/ACA ribonucleoprotein complex non-core subunit NAF1